MNKTYLILGSNLGDRMHYLQQALKMIAAEIGNIINLSELYITEPWGNTSQPNFVNQVVCIETKLSADDLLLKVLSIEKKIGRIRDAQKWRERIIDIDILYYKSEIIKSPQLIIPHPYIKERKFVLVPLAEIASDFIHPIHNISVNALLKYCKDTLNVIRLKSIDA